MAESRPDTKENLGGTSPYLSPLVPRTSDQLLTTRMEGNRENPVRHNLYNKVNFVRHNLYNKVNFVRHNLHFCVNYLP